MELVWEKYLPCFYFHCYYIMLTVNVVMIPGAVDVDIFPLSKLHPDDGQEVARWGLHYGCRDALSVPIASFIITKLYTLNISLCKINFWDSNYCDNRNFEVNHMLRKYWRVVKLYSGTPITTSIFCYWSSKGRKFPIHGKPQEDVREWMLVMILVFRLEVGDFTQFCEER